MNARFTPMDRLMHSNDAWEICVLYWSDGQFFDRQGFSFWFLVYVRVVFFFWLIVMNSLTLRRRVANLFLQASPMSMYIYVYFFSARIVHYI